MREPSGGNWLWSFGLPMTELQHESEGIAATSLEAARAAAAKYAKPENASVVLVGDRAKIEPGIRELNLGEVVILDAEGKPTK